MIGISISLAIRSSKITIIPGPPLNFSTPVASQYIALLFED